MENFIVSARKYRPTTFNQVVGQPTIVQTLKNAIRTNSLAQAFLFTGPRGIGKTTCARILAKTINCLNIGEDTEPCNECTSCRSFNQLASFNIQEMDGASNNSVDNIRLLADQVRIPPQAGKYKVYIIDEVHMLSTSAFNAFLKTLEEPPAFAKFILATTERHKILPTILSRCQIYNFKRISVPDIASHLAWVAKQEKIDFEEEALHIIAQKADGALRDALSIFDQIISFSGSNITYQHVLENLNLLDFEYYFKVMDCIKSLDIPGALLVLDEVICKGFDGHQFINGLGEHLRNLLLCKDPSVTKLLEATENVRNRYNQQSQDFSMIWLVQALDMISKADQTYRTATNKRLHLELLLLQMTEAQRVEEEKKNPDLSGKKDALPASSALKKSTTPTIAPAREFSTVKSPEPSPTLIAPVADTPTPENKPEPVVQEKESTPEEPAPAAGTVSSVPGKKRLSIKEMIEHSGEDATDAEDENPAPPSDDILPMDTNEIQQIIQQYAKEISITLPSFAAAIMAKPATVQPGNRILISFSNKVIADPEHLKNLRRFIRSKVKGSWFTLEPIIEETPVVEKVILTPAEKYRKMTAENPGMDAFVKKLGLEFEE